VSTRYGARVHSVEVVASKSIAFGYLAELHDAEWRTGVREMRLISASPYQLGARHQEVRRLLGRDMISTAQVVVYQENERIDFRRATGWLRPQVSYLVEPIGMARCRVRATMSVPIGPPVVRAILAVLLDRTLVRELPKLATAIESRAASQ
jgi:hypothetical protein